jgi:hypothetical protein
MERVTGKDKNNNNPNIIKTISNILSEIIKENKSEFKGKEMQSISKDKHKAAFDSKKPPSISIQQYIERIVKYSKLEDSTLVITLIYIDRLCDQTQIHLNDLNIHR